MSAPYQEHQNKIIFHFNENSIMSFRNLFIKSRRKEILTKFGFFFHGYMCNLVKFVKLPCYESKLKSRPDLCLFPACFWI